jgi:hypothetical protein
MQVLKAMGRTLALAVTIVMLTGAVSHAAKFNNKKLKGAYLFGVSGFLLDDNDDFGQIAAVGLLTFNGAGGVTAFDVTFTSADTSGDAAFGFDNFTCAPTLSSGSYSVNLDGTGTMALIFSGSSACFAGDEIDFFFVLDRGTGESKIVSTTFTSAGLDETSISETILGMVVSGQLHKRKSAVFIDPPPGGGKGGKK